jgi:AbrB family looped-hinge helix DNA binding protein
LIIYFFSGKRNPFGVFPPVRIVYYQICPLSFPHNPFAVGNDMRISQIIQCRRGFDMKATGIVRRIDDLGRVVIPKEIRRTMRIREGDPFQITLTPWKRFCDAVLSLHKRIGTA